MGKPRRVEPAKFVCWINHDSGESIDDLKAYTWVTEREHAIVELQNGRRALVCGGSHGMTFQLRTGALVDSAGKQLQFPCVEVDGQPIRVLKLIVHTHPEPTGPSDADFRLLKLLNQEESLLFEINGEAGGTRFRQKKISTR
jgi:hypothetical protein